MTFLRDFVRGLIRRRGLQKWANICVCAHHVSDHVDGGTGGCMKCLCPRFRQVDPANY